MLTSQKLLYVLPDVAYVTELLPTKKEHTFAIHVFRQINGEFLDDNDFIVENLEKLVSKIDPAEYHLILPDFIFTNTIIEVADTNEAKVKSYLKDQFLPSLELSKDSHELDTFILTQHQGKSKVQLSALEKTVVSQFAQLSSEKGITITGISPLSWTVKSVISLEPSISVIQVGSILYVALHYIGLDQASHAKVEEIENIAETIKTLKGGEPSIQTVYLLTNELVADQLKGLVSSTLPLQQLATFKEDETQMPSYVKQIIESGMKTLDIAEYHVPKFALPEPGELPAPTVPAASGTPASDTTPAKPSADTIDLHNDDDDETETNDKETTEALAIVTPPTKAELPPPSLQASLVPNEPSVSPAAEVAADVKAESPVEESETSKAADTPLETPSSSASSVHTVSSVKQSLDLHEDEPTPAAEPAHAEITPPPAVPELETLAQFAPPKTSPVSSPATVEATKQEDSSDLSLSTTQTAEETTQAAAVITPPATVVTPMTSSTVNPVMPTPVTKPTNSGAVLKNPHNGGKIFKMVFVTAAVFFATVGVGVGIGLAVLSLANKSNQDSPLSPVASTSNTVTATPTPTPVATPVASSAATIAKDSFKVHVVNATTIAGHAGKTKKALETAGYKQVTAGNAKGKYEAGTYVLLKAQDAATIAALEEATGLDLTFQDTISQEDSAGSLDAVIVLAE